MNDESSDKANVLIVDDTVENLQLLTNMLRQQGYEARPVPSGRLALQAAKADPPDLILLDINMPNMDGYEVCEKLKANPNLSDIPVIFISARTETMDKVRAFTVGAVDYVTKPFEFEEVRARLETHLNLSRARDQLEQSYTKLKELEELRDNLVNMIVHDMASPLFALIGNLDLLKHECANDITGDKKQIFDIALSAGTLLGNMTKELLDVRKLEEGQMPVQLESCNASEIIQKSIETVKSIEADRTIRFEKKSSIFAHCDSKLFRRIIENLVTNGIKHTPETKPLQIQMEEQDKNLRVSVSDEGSGIPEEYREKIFEKFGTLKARKDEKYHSTGLGLAFCKLAVEAQGGQIGVESEPEKGSTFWFTVPLEKSENP